MIVGIDPGENMGIAVMVGNKITETHTAKGLWEACAWISEHVPPSTLVRIEDPGQNRPVFMRKEEMAAIHRGGQQAASALRMAMKRAQNVGQNKQTTKHLIQWMQNNDYKVEAVRPTQHTGTKRSHEYITKIGCAKHLTRTNEHVRDAIMLVVGYEWWKG